MARRRSVRVLTAVVVSTSLLLATAAPGMAKFPYFSVALDPKAPRPGEPVTVTVRTWADAGHSRPAGFAHDGALITGLLVFRRVGDGTGPVRLEVPLAMQEADLYQGDVTLPVGEWRLVAFPHGEGACTSCGAGYPEPIDIVVRDQPLSAFGLMLGVAGVAVAVAIGASTLRMRRSYIRRASAASPT